MNDDMIGGCVFVAVGLALYFGYGLAQRHFDLVWRERAESAWDWPPLLRGGRVPPLDMEEDFRRWWGVAVRTLGVISFIFGVIGLITGLSHL